MKARKVRQFTSKEGMGAFMIEHNTWDDGAFTVEVTDGYNNTVFLEEAAFNKIAAAVAKFKEKVNEA